MTIFRINTAKVTREHKAIQLELYCPNARCLFRIRLRTGRYRPCPKHGIPVTVIDLGQAPISRDTHEWLAQGPDALDTLY
jgi:hypothetical protein